MGDLTKPDWFNLRRITAADIPTVMEVRYATTENPITEKELEDHYSVTPEIISKAIAKEETVGYLCEISSEVVGFGIGDTQSGEVLVLAVHPKYEGRGIGKRVLSTLCKHRFEIGHKQLFLFTTPDINVRAYSFYQFQGWKGVEKVAEDSERMTLNILDFHDYGITC
ncbi:MAG: GNAT family N-acetyltransferase [Gammaproteobacteria bacterium]|nr:GNAT family N-acetyltransferase [Gammaproteobacteria bacterium]